MFKFLLLIKNLLKRPKPKLFSLNVDFNMISCSGLKEVDLKKDLGIKDKISLVAGCLDQHIKITETMAREIAKVVQTYKRPYGYAKEGFIDTPYFRGDFENSYQVKIYGEIKINWMDLTKQDYTLVKRYVKGKEIWLNRATLSPDKKLKEIQKVINSYYPPSVKFIKD